MREVRIQARPVENLRQVRPHESLSGEKAHLANRGP